jgi:4'-phosphopantetheinyl transferase
MYHMSIDAGLRRLPSIADDLSLWRIDLDAVASVVTSVPLSEDECRRAECLRFERDRRRYIAAHVALRELLARALDCKPEALQFTHNEFGKPQLVAAPRCAFNLSHSEGVGLVAIGAGLDVGVDIEVMRELSDVHALAQRCCTSAEYAALFARPDAEHSFAFLRNWTRKEACLKAVGVGLSIGPQAIEVDAHGAAEDGVAQTIEVKVRAFVERVQLRSLSLGEAMVGAVAIRQARAPTH